MAYGQTGAGKTFTTTSEQSEYAAGDAAPAAAEGIVPRALRRIFTTKRADSRVRLAVLEVVNGRVFSLCDEEADVPKGIREKVSADLDCVSADAAGRGPHFYVAGATWHDAASADEALAALCRTEALKGKAGPSHCAFILTIVQLTHGASECSTFTVVDMAGSERTVKVATEAVTTRFNLTLAAFATVVDHLCMRKRHIPYRASPITMLMKPILAARAFRVVATLCPGPNAADESVATLRMAARFRELA